MTFVRIIGGGVRSFAKALGFDIRRTDLGQDPYSDIARLVRANNGPAVLFDAGANVGQTTQRLMRMFPQAQIHAFEPNRNAFQRLAKSCDKANGRLCFFEHSATDMSSFLQPGLDARYIATRVEDHREVAVVTIDGYCRSNGIAAIHLLKSDTQGFDLEVLKGATAMLHARRIGAIYLELTFAKLYERLPQPHEVLKFVADFGFELVSFYQFHHLNNRAAWTDALFVHPEFEVEG
jgi:FkbM family methyltransferase